MLLAAICPLLQSVQCHQQVCRPLPRPQADPAAACCPTTGYTDVKGLTFRIIMDVVIGFDPDYAQALGPTWLDFTAGLFSLPFRWVLCWLGLPGVDWHCWHCWHCCLICHQSAVARLPGAQYCCLLHWPYSTGAQYCCLLHWPYSTGAQYCCLLHWPYSTGAQYCCLLHWPLPASCRQHAASARHAAASPPACLLPTTGTLLLAQVPRQPLQQGRSRQGAAERRHRPAHQEQEAAEAAGAAAGGGRRQAGGGGCTERTGPHAGAQGRARPAFERRAAQGGSKAGRGDGCAQPQWCMLWESWCCAVWLCARFLVPATAVGHVGHVSISLTCLWCQLPRRTTCCC
jgi:hypothetical protein